LHIHFNNFQNSDHFSSTPDGVEILFFSGGESRLSNICLTSNSGPRSGLARFVLERAERTAQNVTKELSG
jgi:hypothetical protein